MPNIQLTQNHLGYFLQKAIYKIFTPQDPKLSSVDILIADIKAEQQKTSELV
ncbi:hypothetical protein ILUMI_15155, partial [Ignelater luminosus]